MTEITPHYITTFKPTHYPSRNELHSTFGGEITGSDYNTEYGHKQTLCSSMAKRIERARRFDYQCLKNAELRERGKML